MLPELWGLIVQRLELRDAYSYARAARVRYADAGRVRCLPSQQIPAQWTEQIVAHYDDRRIRRLVSKVYYCWDLAAGEMGWTVSDPRVPMIRLHFSERYEYTLTWSDYAWEDNAFDVVMIDEWVFSADGHRLTGAGFWMDQGYTLVGHDGEVRQFEDWFGAAIVKGRFDCQHCLGRPRDPVMHTMI